MYLLPIKLLVYLNNFVQNYNSDQSAVMQKPPISFLGLHALQYSKHICLRCAVWREFSGRIPCFALTISRNSSPHYGRNIQILSKKLGSIFAIKISKNRIQKKKPLSKYKIVLTNIHAKIYFLGILIHIQPSKDDLFFGQQMAILFIVSYSLDLISTPLWYRGTNENCAAVPFSQ